VGLGYALTVAALWVSAGVLFLIVAMVPWRWEVTGGLLLVAVGVVAGLAYTIWAPEGLPPPSRLLTTVVFSAPPVTAGGLFLFHHRQAGLRSAA
jgi:hypothetical protein